MKRIHFDNMKNRVWLGILILSLILIVFGTFEIIEIKNTKVNKLITVFGFLLQIVYYSKTFWYKNYMQWNKKATYIRINSWAGKTLSFDNIKKTELNENQLTITKQNGKKVTFDLDDIKETDSQKLNEIIVKNKIASSI